MGKEVEHIPICGHERCPQPATFARRSPGGWLYRCAEHAAEIHDTLGRYR